MYRTNYVGRTVMIQFKIPAALVFMTVVTACAVADPTPPEPPNPYPQLPLQVVETAATYQDLSTAFLDPTDNCFWYMHAGVVETTRLPLRNAAGAQLCMAVPEATPA